MTRFVYVLPAGRFRWEVRVDGDELTEAAAEAIYDERGYAGITKTDTSETRHVWECSQDYARAALRAVFPLDTERLFYRLKRDALIAARAIAILIGGDVQPHDRRGVIQDPDSYGPDPRESAG